MLLAPKVSLEFWDHVHDKSIFNELRSLLDFFFVFFFCPCCSDSYYQSMNPIYEFLILLTASGHLPIATTSQTQASWTKQTCRSN